MDRNRLKWLSVQFGADRFTQRSPYLPTTTQFPNTVIRSEEDVRCLLDLVCNYMDINPGIVRFGLFTNTNPILFVNEEGRYLPNGAAGLYQDQDGIATIRIATSELENLPGLIGTIAHELSHLRLIGEGRVQGEEFDNELLTDLTAVFHGFGIFMGNSPRNWDSQFSTWPDTSFRRPEYMTLPMFAYALAHTAWFQGELKPDWYPYLSYDLKPCFKQAIRYLTETRDSSFAP